MLRTCYPAYRLWWSLALIGYLLLLSPMGWAQYSVHGGDAYCPTGPGVTFDTINYAPDRAMPFDRCFVLKLSFPNPVRVTKFFITPLNAQGEPHARRRDWRVFMRSGYPYPEKKLIDKRLPKIDRQARKQEYKDQLREAKNTRETAKLRLPYSVFYDDILKRAFINISPKSKSKQITLRVPPLDPGREYRIYLAIEDEGAAEEYVEVGDLIVKSKGNFSNVLPAPTKAIDLLEQSQIIHSRSNSKNSQRSLSLYRPTYNEYTENLTSFGLIFNRHRILPDVSYRFLFIPTGATIPNEMFASSVAFFMSMKDLRDPDTLNIKLPFTDITGRQVSPFTDWKGKIYLLTIDETSPPPPAYLSPLVQLFLLMHPTVAKMEELGELELKHNGITRVFTANSDLLGSSYIGLTQSPLDLYQSVEKQRHSLQSPPKLSGCLRDTAVLQLLLKQAVLCPCETEGIKDLTQKDDLMRTISLLSENDTTIISNIMKGLVSINEPLAKPIKVSQQGARIANYTISLTQLNALAEFTRKLATLYPQFRTSTLQDFLTDLNTLYAKISGQSTALAELVKAQGKLKSIFSEAHDLNIIQSVGSGSTSELNLLTESQFRIVPDFGFIGLFKGNNVYDFQDFTPYLGFHIGFRSMDKNLPLRMIRYKSWRHRLSFMSGITLRSLKIENQREDFFGSNSLITGLGFRLNNYFRVTSGVVWFKAIDSNRLTNNKPVQVSPFIGLSLDLDLQNLFGGLKKLF